MRRTWAEERKARLREGISTQTDAHGDWAQSLPGGDPGIRLAAAEGYAPGGEEDSDPGFPGDSWNSPPAAGDAEDLGPDGMGPPRSLMNPPSAEPPEPAVDPGRTLRFFIL